MKFGLLLFTITVISIIILMPSHDAYSRPGLTASLGAGYSDNLYADSSGLGNSYLYNGIKLSSTHFTRIRIHFFYELTYYEYDTNNLINNFAHSPGVSIYRTIRGSRFKWSCTARGYIKKYTDDLSTFDNNRIRFDLEASYFLMRGLQVQGGYQGELSSYADYDVLENSRHRFEIDISRTFPSRTTLNISAAHTLRHFEDGNTSYNWTDIGFKIAQSLNIRTGISLSYLERFSSDGSRPLSTFYIISGVSAYWDSWEGRKALLSLKRILPSAVLSKTELSWWNRKFNYDDQLSQELPWLEGKSSRFDYGFAIYSHLRRQFNLRPGFGKHVAISLIGGFIKNLSDDDYYDFNNYYIECEFEYSIL
jgi:hypothetical protein